MRLHRFLPILGLAVACKPDFDEAPALIEGPRILSVLAEPPEVAPGEPVRLEALFVDGAGRVRNAPVSWSYCAVGKPLTENNAVHEACLQQGVRPIATEAEPVTANVPVDACALFGPDVPPDGSRPRDPDTTGGFFQPVRVVGGTLVGFGFVRVSCNLANTSAAVAAEYRNTYVRNKNPKVAITIEQAGAPIDAGRLPRGATVTLRARWSPDDAESFVAYDLTTQTLARRRESMRVSWFSTRGMVAVPTQGREENDLGTDVATDFEVPRDALSFTVFAVLRDGRGGQAFAELAAATQP